MGAVTFRVGVLPATSLVIASMIGTGVFTSLGFQLADLHSAPPIILVWLLGGLLALCGAFSYAELAGTLPRSGGECFYLGRIYHPALGFMAGLLSAVFGFAAPTALAAMAFGKYLSRSLEWVDPSIAAMLVVVLATVAHAISATVSARIQTIATGLKLALIFAFLAAVVFLPSHGDIRWVPDLSSDAKQIFQPAYATALYFVFYSYSGWNASVYGMEEWHQPERTVARSLVTGTLIVTVLYVALNAAFLRAAPVASLTGVLEIGHVAAVALVGPNGGKIVAGLLALSLIASVSALLWAGPRVLGAIGRDFPIFSWLHAPSRVPLHALALQAVLAIAFIGRGDFEPLLKFTQFGLTLCCAMTVLGLLILRRREPNLPRPFRCPLYPLPPLLFLAMTIFVLIFSIIDAPWPTLVGLGVVLGCTLIGFFLSRTSTNS